MDKMIRPESLGPIAQAGLRYERERAACGGHTQAMPMDALDTPKQPGVSALLQQQEGMLACLSKELAELEDMLDHLRFHNIPTNASAKEQAELSTSSLGGMIQRNNAVIQAIGARLDYLKTTLRGML